MESTHYMQMELAKLQPRTSMGLDAALLPPGFALNSKYTSLAPSRSESVQFDPNYLTAVKNETIDPISSMILMDPTPDK